jgi:anaphase-promoting complex subunit 2
VSNLFWPKLDESDIKLPQIFKEWSRRFEKSFEELKASRTLTWIPNEGIVDLEVKKHGKICRLLVSPMQASLLLLFQDKDEISISTAIDEINCNMEQLRNSIDFWKSHGILFLSGDVIVTIESDKVFEGAHLQGNSDLFATNESKFKQEIEEIWPMLEGMLTNIGPSNVEMIHRTLSMFISDFSLSQTKLVEVLEVLIEKDMLEQDGRDTFKIKE